MEIINPEQYYRSRLSDLKDVGNGQWMAKCPFHEDKNPSLSIQQSTGLWKDFAGCGGGNILQFESKLRNITTKQAYVDLCKEFGIDIEFKEKDKNVNKEDEVDKYHQTLLNNQKAIEKLEEKRGLKLDILKKYKIGLDEELKRITIPIYRNGICVNIRKYQSGASTNKVIGLSGYNGVALFPYDNIKEDTVYIMEGEMDCLLAIQLGLNAITCTGGAGSWKDEWNDYFRSKHVIICYDIDDAGRTGAKKIVNYLRDYALTIKNIDLPITSPANGDFTDYIITHEFTVEDFNQLVEDTKDITILSEPGLQPIKVSLSESSSATYYGKYLETSITISGKDTTPYNIPKEFRVTCRPGRGPKCVNCKMGATGDMEFDVKAGSEDMLKLIKINEFQLIGALRNIAGLSCQNNNITIKTKQNIEEISVIPEMSYNPEENVDYVKRQLYHIGHGIKMNKSYLIEGYNFTTPRDQHATMVIVKAKSTQGTLDRSLLTKDIQEELKIFQCDKNIQAIADKIKEIHIDFSYNVTHIFGRERLLMAIDLCYHSVLNFIFCDVHQKRGWADILVLGDTQCGKSDSIKGLIKHYRAGEFICCDSVSLPGLIGTATQLEKGWLITWGKLPLNNGMLVALDELNSMETEVIEKLSGIRSEGMAEVTKAGGGRTQSRTRLLSLSNPRRGRKLSTYSKGVLAIKELIGKAEDVARFDLAITVADDEVSQKDINSKLTQTSPHKYKTDYCHNLILWAWTRRKDDVVWVDGAEKVVLDLALKLTDRFESDIPLVTPAAQRIKLARLSIALAARLYSTDEAFEKVLVYPAHVEYMYRFFLDCYTSPSMGYDLHSESKKKSHTYIESHWKELVENFKGFYNWRRLKDLLLEHELIKKNEVELQMKYVDKDTRDFFGWACDNRLMFSTHIGYAKHPLFIQMLKKMDDTQENLDIINKAKDLFGGEVK